jgi:TolB protein
MRKHQMKTRRLLIVMAALMAVPILLGVTTNQDKEDQAKIVFVGYRANNSDIYAINADGTGLEILTHNQKGQMNQNPALSPDGSKVVFSSTREDKNPNKEPYISEIYIMNADGTGLTDLTKSGGWNDEPVFSPDGSQIAFISSREGNADIYVMNIDGSGVKRLTDNPFDDSSPAFSPDGSKIAFASRRVINKVEALPPAEGATSKNDIFIMNSDGSGVVRLTDNTMFDYSPAFSPDGAKIVFNSHINKGMNFDIFMMNVDGTDLKQLTDDPHSDWNPTFSPDGKKIAYCSDRRPGKDIWGIYVINADGTGETLLTENLDFCWFPAFQTGGKKG